MVKVKFQTILSDIVARLYDETPLRYRDKFIRFALVYTLLTLTLSISADNDISYNYPNIPLIEIYTHNMEEPTCQRIDPPSGCFGISITNNDYVQGNMIVWMNHKIVYSSFNNEDVFGMKLKIRGNSTGASLMQHPYKIKLNKKVDMFFTGDPLMENKEWILLSIAVWNTQFSNQTTDLTPILGACVSRCLGTPWTPRYRFVNLVMNGTYRGCYVLTEAVSRSDGRINIKKNGFIIEYDAYWWKPGEEYFKTEHCHQGMGYTFKYPDNDDITDSIKTLYREYLNEVEQRIFDVKAEANDYIDYTSFARWLLIHDILGSYDAAGSNIFLYKESMNPINFTTSLLKIGPTWDYDTCFKVGDGNLAQIHDSNIFYFTELIRKPLFIAEYCRQWNEIKDKLYDEVSSYFKTLLADEGEAIDQSIKMSHELYGQTYSSIQYQSEEILGLFKQRLNSLDDLINTPDLIYLPRCSSQDSKDYYYVLSGIRLPNKPKGGIYIKGGRKFINNN